MSAEVLTGPANASGENLSAILVLLFSKLAAEAPPITPVNVSVPDVVELLPHAPTPAATAMVPTRQASFLIRSPLFC
jgi:hypothetical protein